MLNGSFSSESKDYCYVGRLAPSPSGHLHVGHAQTFTIARERANAFHGKLLLRIEDIDVQRCKPRYLTDMIEDLTWFGLNWEIGYPISCYIQSKRFDLYDKALYKLYTLGFVYPCKLSRRDVDLALSAPHDLPICTDPANPLSALQREPIFPPELRPDYIKSNSYGIGSNNHFPVEFQSISSPGNLRVNWRFRVPDDEKPISFFDGYCGAISFVPGRDFGDFLVWRLDGCPAYELAVIVDDILMGVTEVVRGQDLLLSTARQLLLIHALFGLDYKDSSAWCEQPRLDESISTDLPSVEIISNEDNSQQSTSNVQDIFMKSNYKIPRYFHSPLVCDKDGVRLAKRNLARSLRNMREEGRSPNSIKDEYFSYAKDIVYK